MSNTPNSDAMSKGERDELVRLVKARARVAKAGTEQRQAELLADFEQQLASEYKFNDEAWADITAAAQRAIKDADRAVAERCEKIGIPARFRPGVTLQWYDRGENALSKRRAELRAVAKTRLEANARQAKLEIERSSLEQQTTLIAGGLTSGEARAFLDAMPTVEALMPPLKVRELEA